MAEKIVEKPITDIIHESFIEYAREVIEDRALPDARDGLKPVQRRILYTMYLSGLLPEKPFRKSVATVGEVMKSLHPHGDQSIYNAMVKLAQTFVRRYPLIEGHGNFGTMDDSPAAMRYTESRLSSAATWMLRDLEKATVDFRNNYDDTQKEPLVLPAIFPNLLVNGGSGIAVGIASEIPPHHMGEVVDAILAYMDDPKIDVTGLMAHIHGPDFPTGGIVSPDGLRECYTAGVGKIVIRGRVTIEELPGDKRQLVITEIPFQVSKNGLTAKMAQYIEGRQANDVVEIRDESDKNGTRIVVEMSAGGDAESLLEELYKKTDLQTNYSYNMVALVDGKPKTMPLIEIIDVFVRHKTEIIRRRAEFELQKAKDRNHILLGLEKAVSILDDIIKTIRASKTTKQARESLCSIFGFSEMQANAILDIRLQRLTVLEIDALQKENKEIVRTIRGLETLLSSDKNVAKSLREELVRLKDMFADERKTLISHFEQVQIKTQVERFTLQIAPNGKIKKLAEGYRGERGVVLKTDSTKTILLFDSEGNVSHFTGQSLPQTVNGKIVGMVNEDDCSDTSDVLFVTSNGLVKKSAFSEYKSLKNGVVAIKVAQNESVVAVFFGDLPSDLLLFSHNGMAIRFEHGEVRQIGRVAAGVRGVRLEERDRVVGALLVPADVSKGKIGVQTETGASVIDVGAVRKQSRDGKGVRIIKNGFIKAVDGIL